MNNITFKKHYYTWSGLSKHGKKVTGETHAFTLNHAKNHLKQQGITPLTLRKKSYSVFSHLNKKISSQDIAIFFRQLSTLITAGIPIVQSCDILRQSQEKIPFRLLINSLKQEIESGRTLVAGLRKYPLYFDELICNLINAGEQAGTLDTMLKRIAHYKEKTHMLKNKIKQALFYPSIIFLVAIAVTIIMLTCVVPQFAELFQSMHSTLPTFTLIIVAISNIFRQYAWLGIFPILGSALLIPFLKTSQTLKNHFDRFTLKIPFINNILKKIILTRFSRSLATTFSAGVPIADALKIVANISNNQNYTNAILTLQSEVLAGQQLHAAMQQNPLFPLMTVQMVKVGEESGTLANMLEKIAEIYEADVDHLVANFSHLLEPLIMIFLGVLIGGLVIAMYLPIFKLGTIV